MTCRACCSLARPSAAGSNLYSRCTAWNTQTYILYLLRRVNPNIFRIFAYNLRGLSDVYCGLRNPEMEPMWLTRRNVALAHLNMRWPAYESSHALQVWDVHIMAGGDGAAGGGESWSCVARRTCCSEFSNDVKSPVLYCFTLIPVIRRYDKKKIT